MKLFIRTPLIFETFMADPKIQTQSLDDMDTLY